jgi:uncharacterized protein (DUF1684 family)
MDGDEALELADWRRRVSAIYQAARDEAAHDPEAAWTEWRHSRDELFAAHPQSPVPLLSRLGFAGLPYFDYDPAGRVAARVRRADPQSIALDVSSGEPVAFTRVGVCAFDLDGGEHTLDLYWLEGYGGGLFLPFRDGTSGGETYGAGRYLLDTVKGADLGTDEQGRLILDFNFAYNPSCAYDPIWSCPLAPPGNRLDAAVRAGERTPSL